MFVIYPAVHLASHHLTLAQELAPFVRSLVFVLMSSHMAISENKRDVAVICELCQAVDSHHDSFSQSMSNSAKKLDMTIVSTLE